MASSRTVLAVVLVLSAGACSRTPPSGQPPPSSADIHWFVPPDAKNVQRDFGQSGPSISYVVPVSYPAERIICELFNDLDEHGWQPLREDWLNPGLPSGAIRGWGEIVNGTVKPEMHVHTWGSEWINDRGDVMSYGLRYEYPEGTTPVRETLQVVGLNPPAAVVRAFVPNRVSQLRSLVMPRRRYACAPPVWTKYAKDTVRDERPRFAPHELAALRSVNIGDDIDGLADKIAGALRAARPDLKIGVHELVEDVDARELHFTVTCVCTKGKKAEFRVSEAIVFATRIDAAPPLASEPARVLFYWKDGGGSTFPESLIAALGQP